MARRSDRSLAALLLTQRLVDAGAAPLKASEYWALLDVVPDPGALLGRDADAIASDHGVTAELAGRVATLLDAASSFAFALDDAERGGMQVVASLDDEYPAVLRDRLGASAPPLLYVAGDLSLLTHELLGVVGSRDVSEAAAEVATSAAVVAVRAGWGVVSGGAKGIDRLAMGAALGGGGVAVGVLADSLVRAVRDADARRAITDGRLCLCTPYKPTAGFSVASAMGRNKLIYALSRGTLVVASDHDTGGTWAGATEALRRGIAPVLVWSGDGAGPGNQPLAAKGATAVTDVTELVELVSSATPAEPRPSQMTLGV